ncbi:unnamed protein product [Colias eurytheme]|nr:unnamed protein product [Colias eurytheme]
MPKRLFVEQLIIFTKKDLDVDTEPTTNKTHHLEKGSKKRRCVGCYEKLRTFLTSRFEFVLRGGKGYAIRIGKNTFSRSYCNDFGKSIWYCSKRKKLGCKVRIKMLNYDIENIKGEHNHG